MTFLEDDTQPIALCTFCPRVALHEPAGVPLCGAHGTAFLRHFAFSGEV